MEGVTCSSSVPRWMLVILLLVAWIHLTTGKCEYYGHACLGAHGKKRAGRIFPINSVSSSTRVLHSLPVDAVSSAEIIEASIVEPGGSSVTNARDVIKRHLPQHFIINMLKSRLKREWLSHKLNGCFGIPVHACCRIRQ